LVIDKAHDLAVADGEMRMAPKRIQRRHDAAAETGHGGGGWCLQRMAGIGTTTAQDVDRQSTSELAKVLGATSGRPPRAMTQAMPTPRRSSRSLTPWRWRSSLRRFGEGVGAEHGATDLAWIGPERQTRLRRFVSGLCRVGRDGVVEEKILREVCWEFQRVFRSRR